MSIFEFFKKSKNIITDNGINKIYYDNGKGTIKEQFFKINGKLNGEYINYNRNGVSQVKTYKDDVICLTDQQKIEKEEKDKIYTNINVEIRKLIILDELISKITDINFLVQLENFEIDFYAKLIENKLNKKFDEDYIKFYLYSKRNYFIKRIVNYNSKLSSLDFTNHIVNYIKDLKNPFLLGSIKINYSTTSFLKHDIINKLFLEVNSNSNIKCKLSIYGDGRGIDKNIFNQQSFLFGLNIKMYKLIFDFIERRSDEFLYDDSEVISHEEFTANLIAMVKLEPLPYKKPTKKDEFVQKVVDEIHSLCLKMKVK